MKLNEFQIEEKLEHYVVKFNDGSFFDYAIELIYQNKDGLNEKNILSLLRKTFLIGKRGLSKFNFTGNVFKGYELAIKKFKLNSFSTFYLYKNILFQLKKENEVFSFILSCIKIESLREKINEDISKCFLDDGETIYRQIFKSNCLNDASFDELISCLTDNTIYDVLSYLYIEDIKLDRIIFALIKQKRTEVLRSIIELPSFNITDFFNELIRFAKKMNDYDLLKVIYFRAINKRTMSLASFCEFYSLLSEEERSQNDDLLYRFSNRMGYQSVYQLMSPYCDIKTDFSKLSFEVFLYLHTYISKFDASKYKSALFLAIEKELKNDKDHFDFFDVLNHYPNLDKEILALDIVKKFSLSNSRYRMQYLSYIRDNSLFESINLKRYKYAF